MPRSTCRRWLPLVSRACAALALAPVLASAGGPPANDAWAARVAIPALPFADTEPDIAAATTTAADPAFACRRTAATPGARSVWYSYTTGAIAEYVNLAASGVDALIAVYSGDPVAGFELVTGACSDEGGGAGGAASLVGIRLAPGTEYSIEVATFDSSPPAGALQLAIDSARIFAVTKTADTLDGACDDDCSLREAVAAANAGAGAVVVPAGTYLLTRTGAADDGNATGDLDVLAATGIYGAGTAATIVDANDIDRVLHVDPTGSVTLSAAVTDLTLRNGTSANGSGIVNIGSSNSDFIGLARLRIADHVATSQGGGARLEGYARIEDSTITGNRADNDGGGIAVDTLAAARLTVVRSTISNNESRRLIGGGGAIFLGSGALELDTSTLSGNLARGGGGGVLALLTATIAIRDSTIVGNRADALGTSGLSGGGVYLDVAGAVSVANSVLADNRRGTGTTGSDCDSQTTLAPASQDNVVQVPGNCGFAGNNDVTGIAVALGPLADNGGPTATHVPLPGSVAIDTGAASCGKEDQRGAKRPSDGDANGTPTCDRGAVETGDELVFRNGFE